MGAISVASSLLPKPFFRSVELHYEIVQHLIPKIVLCLFKSVFEPVLLARRCVCVFKNSSECDEHIKNISRTSFFSLAKRIQTVRNVLNAYEDNKEEELLRQWNFLNLDCFVIYERCDEASP